MDCRPGCAACCIAPSISSPIPGMPDGKPAGVRCVQLDDADRCRLFGDPRRPAVCASLSPSLEMCGADAAQAMAWLTRLERDTAVTTVPASGVAAMAPGVDPRIDPRIAPRIAPDSAPTPGPTPS